MQNLNDLLKTIFSGFKSSLKSVNLNIENTKTSLENTKASLENRIKKLTNLKMDKNNPTGTGSFSLNRKSGSTVGNYSHAEGRETTASKEGSHAEGYSTTASGDYSHAEGNSTTASGSSSHAEGYATRALGGASHAEGNSTTARGDYSHAEGYNTNATYNYSHAEGYNTNANEGAHAEGRETTASGYDSHAEGNNTTASAIASHAEGWHTTASTHYQHVQGRYNIIDLLDKYAHIIGNGDPGIESNAHTVDWSGNAWFAGDVYVGSTSKTNKDEGSKRLATEEYVNHRIIVPAPSSADDGKILRVVDGSPAWSEILSAMGVSF